MVKGPRKHESIKPRKPQDASSPSTPSRRRFVAILRFLLVLGGSCVLSYHYWEDVMTIKPTEESVNITRSSSATLKKDAPTTANHQEGSLAHYIALSQREEHDKERLLYLLRDHTDLQSLTEQHYQALPTWKQVTDLYGEKPRLVGASPEQCQAFRSLTNNPRKFLAVAGMFNSGTNLLAHTLFQNCKITPASPDAEVGVPTGILWQVPYGKHNLVRDETFRKQAYQNSNDKNKPQDHDDVMPVVMIRDPFWWMISLCKDIYTTHWPKFFGPKDPDYHCPSLWPTKVELEGFVKGESGPIVTNQSDETFGHDLEVGNVAQGIYPLIKGLPMPQDIDIATQHYFPTHVVYAKYKRHYYSKLHIWNEWYEQYHHLKTTEGAPAHRIVLRMEDLLFHTQEVVEQICTCAGGKLVRHDHSNTTTIQMKSQSAKEDHAMAKEFQNETRHGFLDSLIRTSNAQERLRPYTAMDLKYANYHLQPELMKEFQYAYP